VTNVPTRTRLSCLLETEHDNVDEAPIMALVATVLDKAFSECNSENLKVVCQWQREVLCYSVSSDKQIVQEEKSWAQKKGEGGKY
jgi:hypothetical protein